MPKKVCCKNCWWWKIRTKRTGYEEKVLKIIYRFCVRFPKRERTSGSYYCGEFKTR